MGNERRRRGAGEWLATGLAVVGAACALVVVAGVALVAAWLRSQPTAPEVDLDDGALAGPRAAAEERMAQDLDAAVGRVGFAHVVATGRTDRCETGQNNWKIQDEVAVSCRLTLTRVLTFPGEFRPQAGLLADALAGGACETGAHASLREYDERLGQTFRNFPQGYRADDITRAGADCGTEAWVGGIVVEGWITLPAGDPPGQAAGKLPLPCPDVPVDTCRDDDIDLAAALVAAPAGDAYAVVVTDSSEYWTAGWE